MAQKILINLFSCGVHLHHGNQHCNESAHVISQAISVEYEYEVNLLLVFSSSTIPAVMVPSLF